MKRIVLSISAALLGVVSFAQNPGELDTSFAIGGYALSDPYSNTGEAYTDIIVMSDDKIMKAGYTNDGGDTDILVARFLADGTPDSSFSYDGFLVIDLSLGGDEEAHAIYELPNGQILLSGFIQGVGSLDAFILKLDGDGAIDQTFGTSNGYTTFNAGDGIIATGKAIVHNGSEIYVGGTVLVGGQLDIMLFNITATGEVDASFSTSGSTIIDIDGAHDELTALDMKSNGDFVFGGWADSSGVKLGYIGSLSQFGTPTIFGINGFYKFNMGNDDNFVNDLYVDANNDIVFTGGEGVFPNVNGFIQRLTSSGELDVTFANAGSMITDPGMTTAIIFTAVNESPDGSIIATGHTDGASKDLYAMALDPNGLLHNNFGNNGHITLSMTISTNTLTTTGGGIQSDGAVIFGGYLTSQDFVFENMFLLRLMSTIQGVSVEEQIVPDVTVYPNPATERFSLDMADVKSVQLISLDGKVIANWNAQYNYEIPYGITAGTYLLQITTETGVGVTKIMIE